MPELPGNQLQVGRQRQRDKADLSTGATHAGKPGFRKHRLGASPLRSSKWGKLPALFFTPWGHYEVTIIIIMIFIIISFF